MLQTVHDALARRDAAAALAAARAATEAAPQDPAAHQALGLALQLAGDAEGAVRALDRAIALAPEQPQYHLARAGLALGSRDLDAAGAAIGAAVAQNPNTLGAYVLAAFVALGRGQLDEARAQHRLAARVAPEHPLTRCVEANLALAAGDPATAQRLLHGALRDAPEEPLLLSSLALAYSAGGSHAFAEQALRRGLQLQPDDLNLRHMLIATLREQQHFDRIAPELEAVLERAPGDWLSAARLGELKLAAGGGGEGAGAVERVLAAEGSDGGLAMVADRLLAHGQAEAGRALFDAFLARTPQREALWQGRMLLAGDDPAALQAQLERWLAALPESPLALQTRATLREQAGDLDGAASDATAALARDGALLGAQLVMLRRELACDQEALLRRLDALAATPLAADGRSLLHMFRGLALDRLGRHAEAAASWSDAAGPLPPEPPAGVAPAAGADGGADAVVPQLLWGPPGSRVRDLVRLLRGQVPLLEDRFGRSPRGDGLGPFRPDGQMAAVADWAALLRSLGVDPARAVDWLPFLDGAVADRLAPARVLAAIDDPRDLLLNWLAFGSPLGAAPAPLAAADWLQRRLGPVVARIEAGDPQLCRIDAALLDDEPERAAQQVAEHLGLDTAPPAERLRAARTGLGGVPTAFAAGHWRHYANALAEPFARLAPLARRLGYPAD
jgi:tetratricopeptide (TPR) repeat protein